MEGSLAGQAHVEIALHRGHQSQILVLPIDSALALRFVPDRDPNAVRQTLNWQSLLLMVTTVGGLLNGLSNGQRLGWESDYVTGSLLVFATE